MNRADLLKVLKLASPALLGDNEVVLPILKSFKFTSTHVIASNDVISVCLAANIGEKCIVSGKKLTSFLSSCNTKNVSFTPGKKDNMIVKCGGSKLLLASLPESDWPFDFPDIEKAATFKLGDNFFRAIELCSAQSPDTGLGGWMGGILMNFGDSLKVYGVGRGRSIISFFNVPEVQFDGKKERKVVVPSSFCKAAAAMAKEFGTEAALHLTKEHAVVDWGEGENVIVAKRMNVDMPDVVGKFDSLVSEKMKFIEIDQTLIDAIRRASALGDKGTCVVTSSEDGINIRTKSEDGTVLRDQVKLTSPIPDLNIAMAADLLSKRLLECTELAFGKDATIMRSKDGLFIYAAANRND